ncbi:hypothetical protein O1611_g690 [Lasiodiplodia mahajangana]|uniref:Uncharacterized protein n=1 Tax=Lasiodiplodia mahajangana TaxID=1108764 RepID=A0ACC2JZM7_9PEZI|nr:hypothetical protein O1611_g690 [Lasiodiplodia mahajangana]
MESSSYPKFLSEILASGDYVDLTIVCRGHKLPAHKLVVCGQSPEAQTDTLEVDSDPGTCELMIEFLYSGRYVIPPQEDEALDRLEQHLKISAIAESYDIPALHQFAVESIQSELESNWSPDLFTEFLETTLNENCHAEICKMAAEMTLNRIQELSMYTAFFKLAFPKEFTIALLRSTATGPYRGYNYMGNICKVISATSWDGPVPRLD